MALSSTGFQGSMATIDLSGFSKGIYIINISSENLVFKRKVIKL